MRVKVVFLGVGEACDENLSNTSILIQYKSRLLIDCGYSVPQNMWRYLKKGKGKEKVREDFPDGIYISHLHGDHYFGLPFVLLRRWEMKCKDPLYIICRPEMKEDIQSVLRLAYKSIYPDLRYEFLEVTNKTKFKEFCIEIARSGHRESNYSIKVTVDNKTIAYSGDGGMTEQTRKLFNGCDLLIHESYFLKTEGANHENVKNLIEYCKNGEVKRLALVHLGRKERGKISKYISKQKNLPIFLPKTFQEFSL